MTCKNCGTKFEGNFCPRCGAKAALGSSPNAAIPQSDNIPGTNRSSGRKPIARLIWRWFCSLFALYVGIRAFYLGHFILGVVVCLCAVLEIPQIQNNLPEKGKSKITWLIGTVAILATVFAFARCSLEVHEIDQIRGGTYKLFPNVTYEEAFDEFFDYPRWMYIEGSDGNNHVEFTGFCFYEGENIRVRFQFTSNGDGTFSITGLSFNDRPQDQFTRWVLIDTIFESAITS